MISITGTFLNLVNRYQLRQNTVTAEGAIPVRFQVVSFEKAYGKQEQLGLFIRKIIGLDRQAAKRAFRDYLEDRTLTANQIRFIDLVVDYLTKNGVMEADLFMNRPSPITAPRVWTDSLIITERKGS